MAGHIPEELPRLAGRPQREAACRQERARQPDVAGESVRAVGGGEAGAGRLNGQARYPPPPSGWAELQRGQQLPGRAKAVHPPELGDDEAPVRQAADVDRRLREVKLAHRTPVGSERLHARPGIRHPDLAIGRGVDRRRTVQPAQRIAGEAPTGGRSALARTPWEADDAVELGGHARCRGEHAVARHDGHRLQTVEVQRGARLVLAALEPVDHVRRHDVQVAALVERHIEGRTGHGLTRHLAARPIVHRDDPGAGLRHDDPPIGGNHHAARLREPGHPTGWLTGRVEQENLTLGRFADRQTAAAERDAKRCDERAAGPLGGRRAVPFEDEHGALARVGDVHLPAADGDVARVLEVGGPFAVAPERPDERAVRRERLDPTVAPVDNPDFAGGYAVGHVDAAWVQQRARGADARAGPRVRQAIRFAQRRALRAHGGVRRGVRGSKERDGADGTDADECGQDRTQLGRAVGQAHRQDSTIVGGPAFYSVSPEPPARHRRAQGSSRAMSR
ncbi:MAG: hypothetical protein IPG72_06105 [Ardenticatenales bacterium]|nr:hypothetical protein [Ardenticatenales bacterium]